MSKKMTREQMRLAHGRLWRWLAKTGSDDKCAWPGWKDIKERITCECFACEVSFATENERDCRKCPIHWVRGENRKTSNPDVKYCLNDKSNYWKWTDEDDVDLRKAIAARIAKMWPKKRR